MLVVISNSRNNVGHSRWMPPQFYHVLRSQVPREARRALPSNLHVPLYSQFDIIPSSLFTVGKPVFILREARIVHRHKAQRQEYQRTYAAASRAAGKRKVSKGAQARNKRAVRNALYGTRKCPLAVDSVSPNSLCYANHAKDSERTFFMRVAEEAMAEQIDRLRHDARMSTDEDWENSLITQLRSLLEEQLSLARERLKDPIDVPRAHKVAMHGHRRMIAGVHQELELCIQSRDTRVPDEPLPRSLVLNGCRVKSVAFRELSGF
ncbi:hypothetical protein FA95DRAFT_1612724 [Auriscalpium vulgare]|uniref:Uncharacterized protein n=1 Tax=Auriscalpium vulgare TaxID=40419 RepID=A0ACB8R555_9AGAM|nr:hypothetical protein FA95DRAFT_1612724 [Auriscalpium vulgare]